MPESRPRIVDVQVRFRTLANCFPRKKLYLKRWSATRRLNRQVIENNEIGNISQVPTAVHWFRSVLQAVHPTPGRKTHTLVQAAAEERQVPDDTATQRHYL